MLIKSDLSKTSDHSLKKKNERYSNNRKWKHSHLLREGKNITIIALFNHCLIVIYQNYHFCQVAIVYCASGFIYKIDINVNDRKLITFNEYLDLTLRSNWKNIMNSIWPQELLIALCYFISTILRYTLNFYTTFQS